MDFILVACFRKLPDDYMPRFGVNFVRFGNVKMGLGTKFGVDVDISGRLAVTGNKTKWSAQLWRNKLSKEDTVQTQTVTDLTVI